MTYYNFNNFDKEIYANIYLKSIDELNSIFNSFSYKKILGPPDEFPYFKKIIHHIYDIFYIFEDDNDIINKKINLIKESRNMNNIINIIESSIDNYYQFKIMNINKFNELFNIFEELYMICNFFHFSIPINNINNITNCYNSTTSINKMNKKICIQLNYVSYFDYFEFIANNGYNNEDFWSKEGLEWLKKYPHKHPYFWKKIDNIWYVLKFDKYFKIYELINQPIENISYFEAEAYCNFKNGFLPEIQDLKKIFNDYNYSNNFCEWTKTKFNDISNICYGRSFYHKLGLINKDNTKIINKSSQHHFTSFRYITNI